MYMIKILLQNKKDYEKPKFYNDMWLKNIP